MIISGLKVAAKCSSGISKFFVRNVGKLTLKRKYVLLNSFNQSGFNVCMSVQCGQQKIQARKYFNLRGILVVSAFKLIL